MRFHAQRRPLGGTDGSFHGCRRSRGPRSWSQETRRARWRGFVRGVDMGSPGPTGRPYLTALECRADDAPTNEGHGHGIAMRIGAGQSRSSNENRYAHAHAIQPRGHRAHHTMRVAPLRAFDSVLGVCAGGALLYYIWWRRRLEPTKVLQVPAVPAAAPAVVPPEPAQAAPAAATAVASEEDPDLLSRAKGHLKFGNVCARSGKPEKALEHYKTAIELRPSYAAAHHNAGGVCQRLKRFEEAVTHYEAALRIKPTLVEAASNLAVAHLNCRPHRQPAHNHLLFVARCNWPAVPQNPLYQHWSK